MSSLALKVSNSSSLGEEDPWMGTRAGLEVPHGGLRIAQAANGADTRLHLYLQGQAAVVVLLVCRSSSRATSRTAYNPTLRNNATPCNVHVVKIQHYSGHATISVNSKRWAILHGQNSTSCYNHA